MALLFEFPTPEVQQLLDAKWEMFGKGRFFKKLFLVMGVQVLWAGSFSSFIHKYLMHGVRVQIYNFLFARFRQEQGYLKVGPLRGAGWLGPRFVGPHRRWGFNYFFVFAFGAKCRSFLTPKLTPESGSPRTPCGGRLGVPTRPPSERMEGFPPHCGIG